MLRLELGLTQAEAAHVVMTSPMNWQRWEKKAGMPAGLWELFSLLGPQVARTREDLVQLSGRSMPRAPRTRKHSSVTEQQINYIRKSASEANGDGEIIESLWGQDEVE